MDRSEARTPSRHIPCCVVDLGHRLKDLMFSKTSTGIFAATLVLGCASATTAQAAETLKLDMASTANLTANVAAVQSSALVAGGDYVVTVSGTGSYWSPADQPAPFTCGAPEAAPIAEPTPGRPFAPATLDAATIFAAPIGVPFGPGRSACAGPNPVVPPVAGGGFKFGVAGALVGHAPIGGQPSSPNPAHTYSYSVVGTGVPLGFQFVDERVNDNSGIFTIVVRTKAECDAVNCTLAPTPTPTSTPTPTVTPTPTPTPTTPPIDTFSTFVARPSATQNTPAAGSAAAAKVAAASCISQGVLAVRLVPTKHAIFTKAVYAINGVKRLTVSGRTLFIAKSSTVPGVQKLRDLRIGTIRLTVVVTTSRGKKITERRTYSHCTPPTKNAKTIVVG